MELISITYSPEISVKLANEYVLSDLERKQLSKITKIAFLAELLQTH